MCSAHSGEEVRFCLLIIGQFYDELVFYEVLIVIQTVRLAVT
jgi:hypothetical protein